MYGSIFLSQYQDWFFLVAGLGKSTHQLYCVPLVLRGKNRLTKSAVLYHSSCTPSLTSGLDNRTGVRPMDIRETFCRKFAKIVLKEAGDQFKMVFGNIHMCVGMEAVIEGGNHTVGDKCR